MTMFTPLKPPRCDGVPFRKYIIIGDLVPVPKGGLHHARPRAGGEHCPGGGGAQAGPAILRRVLGPPWAVRLRGLAHHPSTVPKSRKIFSRKMAAWSHFLIFPSEASIFSGIFSTPILVVGRRPRRFCVLCEIFESRSTGGRGAAVPSAHRTKKRILALCEIGPQ